MTRACPAIRGRLVTPEVSGRLRRAIARPTLLSDDGVLLTDGDAYLYVASAAVDGYRPDLRGRIKTPTITGRWC